MEELMQLAARQHGVVWLAQVRAAGIGRHELGRLLASGRLSRIAPRAFLIGGAPLAWPGRLLAECRSAGEGVIASHRSAAALWGLNGFDPPRIHHVSVPRGRRPQERVAVRYHLSSDLHLAGNIHVERIPVTSAPRTLLDLAATESNRAVVARALDSARKKRLVTWGGLRHCVDQHARPGRGGVMVLRDLIDLRDGQENESWLQEEVFDLLVASGLPRPRREVLVTTPRGEFRFDLAYVEERLGLECKGKTDHLTDAAFEADPLRENALTNAGWRILVFTRFRYLTDPDGIVADVAAALSRTPGRPA